MDWTTVIQKISTPLQLAAVVVASITIVAGDYAKVTSLNPLPFLIVAILGGLGVLAILVHHAHTVVSKKERQFVVQSGIMRFQILIEWITDFRKQTSIPEVCRELEGRLQELQASLNFALRVR
jgi:hypothetical protein